MEFKFYKSKDIFFSSHICLVLSIIPDAEMTLNIYLRKISVEITGNGWQWTGAWEEQLVKLHIEQTCTFNYLHIFCTCAQEPFWCKLSICLIFPDFNIIHLGFLLIVFMPGWRLFRSWCLCKLFFSGSLCSLLNKSNTLPPFNSRAEFAYYCKQTSAETQKIMWQESQRKFINDMDPTESWPDLKCMPINLAGWKGMTMIESSGQYLHIDCLFYDQKHGTNGTWVISLFPINRG